ncbi:branched-chain amino acid transport system substrate-binding protein [Nitrobacteraceae bacterium AZCC 1564]
MTVKALLGTAAMALMLGSTAASAQSAISLGHLADYSGATSDVGTPFGQGVADAYAWVNKHGGINGAKVNVDTVDYGYQVPRAIAQYKKWSGSDKVAAILGWGTADTEALTGFLAQDKIPDISGSYSAALSDPTGASGKAKAAPYNFFYGPSYSDALRGMLTWAAEDWKSKGKPGKPKYVHMGGNHPYPNAPKAAGEAIAAELGFEVLPAIVFALTPGDYSAQCLTLKSSGANYAYLGNTAGSNISVLNACKAAGTDVQFMGNVWGMDENAAKAAGAAADGVVFPLRTAVAWGGNAPGMKTMQDISKMSDPDGKAYRPVHYVAGVCTALYMKEAVEWAAKNGGATGEKVKNGFYQKANWVPAGMEGVCNPSTWTEKDHRPTLKVDIYRMKVSGPTDASVADLVKSGTIKLEKVKTVDLPRKPEWLGW